MIICEKLPRGYKDLIWISLFILIQKKPINITGNYDYITVFLVKFRSLRWMTKSWSCHYSFEPCQHKLQVEVNYSNIFTYYDWKVALSILMLIDYCWPINCYCLSLYFDPFDLILGPIFVYDFVQKNNESSITKPSSSDNKTSPVPSTWTSNLHHLKITLYSLDWMI